MHTGGRRLEAQEGVPATLRSGCAAQQPVSFGLRFVHLTNEAQLEAHRLLSSTAGARSGAARASRSWARTCGCWKEIPERVCRGEVPAAACVSGMLAAWPVGPGPSWSMTLEEEVVEGRRTQLKRRRRELEVSKSRALNTPVSNLETQEMSGTKARTEDTTENTVLQDTTHSRSAFGHQGLLQRLPYVVRERLLRKSTGSATESNDRSAGAMPLLPNAEPSPGASWLGAYSTLC